MFSTSNGIRLAAALALLAAAPLCPAQISGFAVASHGAAGLGGLPGMRLYEAAMFAGYTSSGLPFSAAVAPVGRDGQYGASATFGWRGGGRKWDRSVVYTGTYLGSVRLSELNSANHALSLGAAWKPGPRSTLAFSASATDSTLDNFMMTPSVLRTVTAIPASFDDLAAAMLGRQYSNTELASLLTGAPIVESPARSVLFGDRMLNMAAGITLTHSASRRLSFQYSLSAGRGLHLKNHGRRDVEQIYLLPRTTSAGAGVSINYSVTPRTFFGVSLSSNRTFSRYDDAYLSSGSLSLGRILSRRWVAQAQAGGGYITPVRGTNFAPRRMQPLFGGSLGFKDLRHTVVVAHSRSLGDAYGLGAGGTYSTAAAWTWSPNREWSFSASVGQVQMQFQRGLDISGWIVSAGASRALSRGTSVSWQYAYLQNYAGWTITPYSLDRHTVSLILSWQADTRPAR